MGSGGQKSMSSKIAVSPIIKSGDIKTIVAEHRGYGNYDTTVLDAKVKGTEITLRYDTAVRFDQISKKVSEATFELKAGVYYKNKRNSEVNVHNLDLSKATVIKGKTYKISPLLREAGFKWNRDLKQWERP